MLVISIWVVALVILNVGFWIARFLKPAKSMVELTERMLEEQQKCKFELAKAAEEISLIRKSFEEQGQV